MAKRAGKPKNEKKPPAAEQTPAAGTSVETAEKPVGSETEGKVPVAEIVKRVRTAKADINKQCKIADAKAGVFLTLLGTIKFLKEQLKDLKAFLSKFVNENTYGKTGAGYPYWIGEKHGVILQDSPSYSVTLDALIQAGVPIADVLPFVRIKHTDMLNAIKAGTFTALTAEQFQALLKRKDGKPKVFVYSASDMTAQILEQAKVEGGDEEEDEDEEE